MVHGELSNSVPINSSLGLCGAKLSADIFLYCVIGLKFKNSITIFLVTAMIGENILLLLHWWEFNLPVKIPRDVFPESKL